MKISVNTTFSYTQFYLNYGSTLQCYALQKYLQSRGHDATLLRDFRANPIPIIKRFKYIKNPKLFFRKIAALGKQRKFMRTNLKFSDRAYFSYSGLVKHCPDVDCHIAGSDQIWHSSQNFRYLTYAKDEQMKLSYAVSFGMSAIPENMGNEIKPYLKRFSGISVRERSGVEILKKLGFDAVHVLDPTLLLDWEQYPYREVQAEKPYVYCYFLNLNNRESVTFDYIKHYFQKQNVDVKITAPLNYDLFAGEELIFPAVEEWLGLYKDAKYMFTNTYHGLLFCIIFKKQFVFFKQAGSDEGQNDRFVSILGMLGLEERIIDSTDKVGIDRVINTEVDYEKVYNIIREKRVETDKFFGKYGI